MWNVFHLILFVFFNEKKRPWCYIKLILNDIYSWGNKYNIQKNTLCTSKLCVIYFEKIHFILSFFLSCFFFFWGGGCGGRGWLPPLTFIYIENVVRLVLLLFYCDCQKFTLTGGYFIFLFMVTGRGIIFICTAGYYPLIILLMVCSEACMKKKKKKI